MTALVAFDIEAVPDFEAARRLLAQPIDTPDADIRRMLGERYSRNGEDPTTAFLKVPIYRIVCIAAPYAQRDDGGGPWTVTQIGGRSVGEKTEAELLLGFVKSLPVDSRGTGPILVTFGGNGFDLPLLRYRAFALGVPVPGLHGGGHRNYWHRFGSDHIFVGSGLRPQGLNRLDSQSFGPASACPCLRRSLCARLRPPALCLILICCSSISAIM